MQTLQLKMTEQNAKKHYPKASPEMKSILEDTFGAPFFKQDITDQVKTFEDACAILGTTPAQVLPFPEFTHIAEQKALNAVAKIWIITKALNEGWVADMSDIDQVKYYPWFEKKSGSGLSYDDFGIWRTLTRCGVRFAFATKEKAIYAGKQFTAIYEEYFI